MEALLTRFARSLPTKDKTERVIFLINNYDQILTVMEVCYFLFFCANCFQERDVESDETSRFHSLLTLQISQFVQAELRKHFPQLMELVSTHYDAATGETSEVNSGTSAMNCPVQFV